MGLRNVLAYSKAAKQNLPSQYYNNLGYDDFKKGQYGQLKPGYISSSTPLHSGYGAALYSKPSKKTIVDRGLRNNYPKYGMSKGFYIYKDPEAERKQQNQVFRQELLDTANQTQADIAKQLQIVQNDKTAVSKMMDEYSKQLADEADRKKKADEAARIAAATSAANQSRSGQTANLQIQPASSTPKTAGTQTFKKRSTASNRKQQLTSGINLGTSSLLNI